MNETRTASILQRVPVILAVTAHSYGLELKARESRRPAAAADHRRAGHAKGGDKPGAGH